MDEYVDRVSKITYFGCGGENIFCIHFNNYISHCIHNKISLSDKFINETVGNAIKLDFWDFVRGLLRSKNGCTIFSIISDECRTSIKARISTF